ncbi:hypothetical protein CDD81_1351 [Ophiocordyceps australis]|uniref:Uncharacterized protein n=1 Tax=Ophiocordyceps australis TaxID=1399860 RepID=A0A2C5XTR4_9HYPO|nr:hypothetical protein CDD81_1351 [Ophiocordyceps australis]
MPTPDPEPSAPLPGPRATRLAETFNHALLRTLQRVSNPSGFAACFATIDAPDVLRVVQEQMVKLLSDKCQKEFQRIMDSRDLVSKLNEFEALVAAAAARRAQAGDAPPPTPPHVLSAETIIAAHSHAALDPILSSTTLRLAQRRAQNARLVDCLAQQTAAMDALFARLDEAKADVVAAAQALDAANDGLSCVAIGHGVAGAAAAAAAHHGNAPGASAATDATASAAHSLDSPKDPPDAADTADTALS